MVYGLWEFTLGPPRRGRPEQIPEYRDNQILVTRCHTYFNILIQQ